MCAYNAVDGKPACVSDPLLQDHLRKAWHFGGYVVSDCGARTGSPQLLLKQAADTAAQAYVVVAVVGLSTNLEGEEMNVALPGFAGSDCTFIELPRAQQIMLERVFASGKPLLIVLMNGSALAVNWAQQHAAAHRRSLVPGRTGRHGDCRHTRRSQQSRRTPSGNFLQKCRSGTAFDEYGMSGRTYRFFHGVPLFPFGYGLSYTTFAYGNVQSSHRTLRAADALSVRVTITNTGDRAGDEVAQLYLQPISKIDVAANCVKRFHAHSIAT